MMGHERMPRRIIFRAPDEMERFLAAAAAQEHITISEFIRALIWAQISHFGETMKGES